MDIRIIANIAIDYSGLLLCLLSIIGLKLGIQIPRQIDRQFVLFFGCIIFTLLSAITTVICGGHPGPGWRVLLLAAMFMMYFFCFLQLLMISTYLLTTLKNKGREFPKLNLCIYLLSATQVILLILSQFTGILYYLDDSNIFQRGPLYALVLLLGGVLMIIDLWILIHGRKVLTSSEYLAFSLYLILPLFALILQIFLPGIHVLLCSIVFSAVVMFFFIISDQTRQYYLQQQEIERNKTTLMLSQIQPHFLYNSLGVIQELCHRDPDKAEEATLRFSRFLRRNMDSLTMQHPIPFSDELEHTNNYLELAKMRFGDQLQVKYDIETTDFMIPTLTLQPIVENAVRHGIRKKEEGGTITISTRETPEKVELIITDNGPGIGPEEPVGPGTKHVGLYNVSERIRRLCGGTLELDFQPGKGACAVITLPKKGGD